MNIKLLGAETVAAIHWVRLKLQRQCLRYGALQNHTLMDFWLCEVEYRYATLALEIQVGVEFRVAAMANLDVWGFSVTAVILRA